MKTSQLVIGIGVAICLGLLTWYLYMQQTPTYERTHERGLPPDLAAAKKAKNAKPAAKPAEKPKTKAPGSQPAQKPAPAPTGKPGDAPVKTGTAPSKAAPTGPTGQAAAPE